MIVDINDPKNYSFEVKGESIICYGWGMGTHWSDKNHRWEDWDVIATKKDPYIWLTTNNLNARILRIHLHRLQGAKKIEEKVVPNWDEDPYGRRVQRGIIVRQKWDVSKCFK